MWSSIHAQGAEFCVHVCVICRKKKQKLYIERKFSLCLLSEKMKVSLFFCLLPELVIVQVRLDRCNMYKVSLIFIIRKPCVACKSYVNTCYQIYFVFTYIHAYDYFGVCFFFAICTYITFFRKMFKKKKT